MQYKFNESGRAVLIKGQSSEVHVNITPSGQVLLERGLVSVLTAGVVKGPASTPFCSVTPRVLELLQTHVSSVNETWNRAVIGEVARMVDGSQE